MRQKWTEMKMTPRCTEHGKKLFPKLDAYTRKCAKEKG